MPKIECKVHGITGGTLVSLDIALYLQTKNMPDKFKLIPIRVESFLDTPTTNWITEDFYHRYKNVDFNEVLTLEYLDEIESSSNDFLAEIKPVCSVCFKNTFKNIIC